MDKYQSRDAMNQIESQVRGTLNDVTNGYYPLALSNIYCGTGAFSRGANQSCVFAGKSIEFQANGILVKTWLAPSDIIPPITYTDLTYSGSSLDQIIPYNWGITPISNSSNPSKNYLNKTYFILNTVYNYTYNTAEPTSFTSGAQNVVFELLNDSGTSPTLNLIESDSNNDKLVCFTNGNEISSLEFLTVGSLGVQVNFNDSRCNS